MFRIFRQDNSKGKVRNFEMLPLSDRAHLTLGSVFSLFQIMNFNLRYSTVYGKTHAKNTNIYIFPMFLTIFRKVNIISKKEKNLY